MTDSAERLRAAIGAVLVNATSYPAEARPYVLGCDMGALIDKATTAALAALSSQPETVEWGVEERSDMEGEWDRIDDGRGWSSRRGRPYTEAEARERAGRGANGVPAAGWRRVVSRHVTPWLPVPALPEGDQEDQK